MKKLSIAVVLVALFAYANRDEKPHYPDPAPITQPSTAPGYTTSAEDLPPKTFLNYACTVDCGGHQAGYDWAEQNGIDDEDACDAAAEHSNSPSFGEGCKTYVAGESPESKADGDEDQ